MSERAAVEDQHELRPLRLQRGVEPVVVAVVDRAVVLVADLDVSSAGTGPGGRSVARSAPHRVSVPPEGVLDGVERVLELLVDPLLRQEVAVAEFAREADVARRTCPAAPRSSQSWRNSW